MANSSGRIRAFDWLRGIAVVFMVETHALVLTRPELRAGIGFARLNFLNGLIAPSFIFASGFSLALVQVRGAVPGKRAARVRRTLRRILEVLAVGVFINIIWFPVLTEPKWLVRMDILPCIAFSLLIALPVFAALAPWPRALVASTLVLAAVVFGIAPLLEHVQGPLGEVLNRNGSMQSVFPLVPWAGYVFLGASVGAAAAGTTRRGIQFFLLGLAVVGAVLWALAQTFVRIYPEHVFWVSDPSNHGERWTIVCIALIVLLELEGRFSERLERALPVRLVTILGTSSLAAYFFHEMLIYYQFFGVSTAKLFRDRLSWGWFLLAWAVLAALTTALAALTDRLYPYWDRWVSGRKGEAPTGPRAAPRAG